MPSSAITSKGQVTLPKAIRDRLGVRPGDRVAFREHEDGTVVVEPAARDLLELRGCVRTRVRGVTLQAMDEAVRRFRDAPMIAIDTNVLVRFLVEDDAAQSDRAGALIRRATGRSERLYVPEIVVCETVWVLTTAYRVARAEVANLLEKLLQSRQLEFQDGDLLARALTAFRGGRGDFADYVVRERARAAGCSAVATFDRALLREPGFEAP